VVADREADRLTVGLRRDLDPTAAADELDRVADEVGERLLQTPAVA
jgi:hypothetical protein